MDQPTVLTRQGQEDRDNTARVYDEQYMYTYTLLYACVSNLICTCFAILDCCYRIPEKGGDVPGPRRVKSAVLKA